MIAAELKAQIRHWFHAEHWKVGTIATQLGLHPDTVRRALQTERFRRGPSGCTRLTDPIWTSFARLSSSIPVCAPPACSR